MPDIRLRIVPLGTKFEHSCTNVYRIIGCKITGDSSIKIVVKSRNITSQKRDRTDQERIMHESRTLPNCHLTGTNQERIRDWNESRTNQERIGTPHEGIVRLPPRGNCSLCQPPTRELFACVPALSRLISRQNQ